MESVVRRKSRVAFGDVLMPLFGMMVVTCVGMFAGKFVPSGVTLMLLLFSIGMVIWGGFAKKGKVGYTFLTVFSLIWGIGLYGTLVHYATLIGPGIVLGAAVATALAFGISALYVTLTKADFRPLGGFLFIALVALVGVQFANLFFHFTTQAHALIASGGVLIFVGYILYDLSRMVHDGYSKEEIPWMVLALYLDVLNLFLQLLQLAAALLGKDDN